MQKSQKIFLGCLPEDSCQIELTAYFSTISKISGLKLKLRSNKLCAGYGHFFCDDPAKLPGLVKKTHFYKDRSIEVRLYLKGEELKEYQADFNNRRIFVGNLPEDMTSLQLVSIFNRFGLIERAYIANNPDKDGNHFGFVVFKDPGVIETALRSHILISGFLLIVKKAIKEFARDLLSPSSNRLTNANISSEIGNLGQNPHKRRKRKRKRRRNKTKPQEDSRNQSQSQLPLPHFQENLLSNGVEEEDLNQLYLFKQFSSVNAVIAITRKIHTNHPIRNLSLNTKSSHKLLQVPPLLSTTANQLLNDRQVQTKPFK